jgi:SNF family Na+-dependent transporter
MMLTLGVIIALAGLAMGLGVIFDHTGGFFWFYWIAPLLLVGVGGLLIKLTLGYWMKVGKLETKGRPRSD